MFGPQNVRKRWRVDEITITKPDVIKRAIGAAAIGNITEWYDFGVYGYLATTIDKVFFPNQSGAVAAVLTAALFAVAFLVRPFGGMFFGPLSDRIGRNKVLAITMIMMALGTFCIGLVPSYAAIGLAAPFLLLACRLVQGFSTGGEYGNAMTFIAEYAPDRRRGFLGSLLEVGTFTGYLLGASIATVMTAVLSDQQMLSWGWRLPFFVALPLGLIGVYLRTKLADTPAYLQLEKESEQSEQQKAKEPGEFKKIFKLWPNMLACIGLVLAWNVTNYMLTAYMPTFFSEMADITGKSTVSDVASEVLQIIVMAVCLVLIPIIGKLSDRFGRKIIVRAGSAALIVLAIPSMLLITNDSLGSILGGLLIMGLSLICFSATMPSTLPSLFPTAVRAGALSIAFNISVSLFGGTTSTVMSALVGATHNLMWPAYYLMAAGVIGFIAIHRVPETNGRPLWGSTPAASSREEAKELVEELASH
ncbi:MFS transporter [Microlunatus elymi]|uniref:Putative proline/betaine transporter n=1 Tax=Microlunatus elymi TaxID=2596828 RepID=A0A516PYC5_9ACTN|nr:MFS transporter [Microlunatus elymi]QDP96170.1 MFS transporter [Microlunatus elymi]